MVFLALLKFLVQKENRPGFNHLNYAMDVPVGESDYFKTEKFPATDIISLFVNGYVNFW